MLKFIITIRPTTITVEARHAERFGSRVWIADFKFEDAKSHSQYDLVRKAGRIAGNDALDLSHETDIRMTIKAD